GFSAFALLLAGLGIYALISDSVIHGAAEFRIRTSLAPAVRILQVRILVRTVGLAGVGMAFGTACAWFLSRALRSLLVGVTSNDPATFLGMMAILTAVACLAGCFAALR